MQYRNPVGGGPFSNTWPRCALHFLQCTSTRLIPRELSTSSSTIPLFIAEENAGQPHPELYFEFDLNNSVPQPAHEYVPSSKNSSNTPLNGISVAFSHNTRCRKLAVSPITYFTARDALFCVNITVAISKTIIPITMTFFISCAPFVY